MSTNKLPVFYHVPKNAGTYVINSSLLFLREYRRSRTNWLRKDHETIKNIEIINNSEVVARLLAGDPDNICSNENKIINDTVDSTHHYIALKDVEILLNLRVFMFMLIIEDAGFTMHLDIKNRLQLQNDSTCWIILREPFSRSVSLYNYLTCEISSHEPTHGSIQTNYENYIASDQFESNWTLRSLASLSEGEDFTEQHCESVFNELDNFNVYNISETDQLIDRMFDTSYKLTRDSFPDHFQQPAKHENKLKNKIRFEDLNFTTQQMFLDRTYWDRKLWERYCK